MKKLESINSCKFELSEQDLLQIKGGYDVGSMDNSYNYYYTSFGAPPNEYTKLDADVTDICVDY